MATPRKTDHRHNCPVFLYKKYYDVKVPKVYDKYVKKVFFIVISKQNPTSTNNNGAVLF